MAEAKLGDLLSKTTFEDVIDGPTIKLEKKPDEVVIPDKPADVVDDTTDTTTDTTDTTDTSEEGLYEQLTKTLGYEVEGEFEESVEGIAEYTKQIGQKMAEEEIKDLFDSFPDVKEYLQFRLNDGDPAKYFESKYGEVDFSKYTVDEKDETTQEVIVRKYLASQGAKDEEINETIKDYKETNLLYKTAKRVSGMMVESQRAKKEEVIAKQAEQARIAEMQREEMVAEISTTIEKGSLHNFTIPEKERKEFRAWLLQPDVKGQTRRQSTMNSLTLAQKLELEYLAFKGFNIKDLVQKEVTQTRVNFLKKGTDGKGSRLGGAITKDRSKPSALSGIKLTDLGL